VRPADDAKLPLPPAAYPWFAYAFWSDTAHNFGPLELGPVQPGDVVHASLTLSRGRWWLRFSDHSSLLFVHFWTRQEGSGPLGSAEWSQEDVSHAEAPGANTGRLFPYPRLSTVAFEDLHVNGVAPSSTPMQRVSASIGAKREIDPSPVRDDAFTVGPAH
jgi:hypothetical protein